MIGKILLTAAVIIAAMLFLRHQGSSGRGAPVPAAASRSQRRAAMLAALGVVALTLAISAGIYYSQWQDEHRIASVRVVNGHTGAEQRYHVYRRDLRERGFRTIDGRDISLSDSERMEVTLEDGD